MKKLILALLFVSSSAFAGNCDQLYIHSKQIAVKNTVELCSSFYVVAHNKEVKGPIVSFERFNAEHESAIRIDTFRSDTRLPFEDRSELKYYLHSGYDRGHMTPAADASNANEMRDTFLLSNMTPQSKKLNRVKWRMLEDHVRHAVKGVTYVATVAIYGKDTLLIGNVGIPTMYYKIAWYADGTNEAYSALNRNDAEIKHITIEEINKVTGIQFPK